MTSIDSTPRMAAGIHRAMERRLERRPCVAGAATVLAGIHESNLDKQGLLSQTLPRADDSTGGARSPGGTA